MSSETDTAGNQTLDARDIDGEPFEQIMDALNQLGPNETLLLINSFEPEPLYNVLEQRGYTYKTSRIESDEWHISIQSA